MEERVNTLINNMFNEDGSWKRESTYYFQKKAQNILDQHDVYEEMGSIAYNTLLIIANPTKKI